MLGELVPCGGGDPIPLLKGKLLVGRMRDCDIVLGFANISGKHCQLELLNGYWYVRDLRSRNGIQVNGMRCDSKFLLPGDELSIAKHRYEVTYEPAAGAPPPEEENPFALSLLEKAGLMRRQEQDRRLRLPPSAKRIDPARSDKFSADENQALEWLKDDDE
ncbi:MAG: FHA domain-containing protein [Planctomycetaceae bacterium]|nr:FHA domain-containing protein [Planctomycetaceae bacterium]